MNAASLADLGGGLRAAVLAVLFLLLGAIGFQLTVYGALTDADAAAPPAAPGSLPQPSGRAAPLGDTRWGSGTNTYCEAYVEWRFGLGNLGATAFQAYLGLARRGLVHPGPPPAPDDLVYFGPSPDNEMDGHVGVYDGNGRFTSVTYFGLQQEPMAGWRAPYLGWVRPGDIKGQAAGAAIAPRG